MRDIKNMNTDDLIKLYDQVIKELEDRRYFEYLENKGKWFRDVKESEGKGRLIPIEDMKEVLNAIDEQEKHLSEYPQLAAYKNTIVDRESWL